MRKVMNKATVTPTPDQGWGEYYSGTRLAQNDKHEYTKNIVLEYYSSTDFPVLVLVCWVLAPALPLTHTYEFVLLDFFISLIITWLRGFWREITSVLP